MHLKSVRFNGLFCRNCFKSRYVAVNKKSTERHQQRTNTASENRIIISLPEKGKKAEGKARNFTR